MSVLFDNGMKSRKVCSTVFGKPGNVSIVWCKHCKIYAVLFASISLKTSVLLDLNSWKECGIIIF